jgi:putative peptide zinc metalloprotease protein
VRRADGQVIQLTPLLYSVAEKADGDRDNAEIARLVSEEIGRKVSADNVRFLVDEKLRPLGVLAAADGSSPDVDKLDPLLALKFRAAVIPQWLSRAMAATFQPLFFGPLILAVIAGVVVTDVWLFLHHGVAQAVRQAMYEPGVFLVMFAMIVLSAAFHETGHAAACRYGGADPGRMGCGLYLAWPAFYTDVTDAYRLGRRGRLRTDLGGVYFNAVFVLLTVGAYVITRFEPLLLLVVIEHIEIVHQLLPVIRLDGYYIVADLTGVPDLFTRIKPILVSMVPGRRADEKVVVLKRWVRVAVTAWVLIVVPLLALQLLIVLMHLPRILATAWDSGAQQLSAAGKAFGAGHTLAGVSAIVQVIVLALPLVGILLMLARLAKHTARWMWRSTDGRPVLRTLALGVAAVVVAALGASWIPRSDYTPIKRGERGTVADGVRAVRRLPSGHAPLIVAHRAASGPRADGGGGAPSTTTTSTPSTSTTLKRASTGAVPASTSTSVRSSSSPSTTPTTASTSATSSPPTTTSQSTTTTSTPSSTTTSPPTTSSPTP